MRFWLYISTRNLLVYLWLVQVIGIKVDGKMVIELHPQLLINPDAWLVNDWKTSTFLHFCTQANMDIRSLRQGSLQNSLWNTVVLSTIFIFLSKTFFCWERSTVLLSSESGIGSWSWSRVFIVFPTGQTWRENGFMARNWRGKQEIL